MKKFFKFLGSAAVLCATVAGGIFAYKKFFAPDPFEDDLDDDLEEETGEAGTAERGYVSLTPEEEKTEETPSEEPEASQEEAAGETAREETAAE